MRESVQKREIYQRRMSVEIDSGLKNVGRLARKSIAVCVQFDKCSLRNVPLGRGEGAIVATCLTINLGRIA